MAADAKVSRSMGNEYDDTIYRNGGLTDDHRGLARLAAIDESFPYPTRPELSRAGKMTWRESVMPFWIGSQRYVHRFERETFAEHIDRRCSKECADVVAFARLAEFNERKKRGEVLDRRRGVDIVCPTCGISYAAFRSGLSFVDARRDFITDDPNRKTGHPRRHGRRNGVLGKMREWKQLAWNAHVDQCASVAQEGAA